MKSVTRPASGWIHIPDMLTSASPVRRYKYSTNLDYLIAAVVYLGTQPLWWARTVPNLAMELTLDEAKLREVFVTFPGIFRRSAKSNGAGEYFYSLQARYAKRVDFSTLEAEVGILPLASDELSLVCGFIQKMAEGEVAEKRARTGIFVAVAAAVLSAIAAVAAASAKILLGTG